MRRASAVETLDEAFHVLRRTPASPWVWYYAGTLPFLLAVLTMRDASLTEDSLVAAVLFLSMSAGQSLFASRLREVIAGEPMRSVFTRASIRRACIMSLVQSTKLFMLPLALLATLPLAWAVAFYENYSALSDADLESFTGSMRRASALARLDAKQNWLVLGLLLLFALAVFLNVALALAIAPQLLEMLLGVETQFTISGAYALRNSTFLFAALAVTYAILDPLVKATYAVRCFHGEARQSGADLRAAWAVVRVAAIVLLLVLPACAQQAVSAPELKASAQKVLASPQYHWSSDRPNPEAFQSIQRVTKWLIDRVDDILSALFPAQKQAAPAESGRKPKAGPLRALTWGLVVCIGLLVVIIVWRNRRPKTSMVIPSQTAATVIDLVTADQLPEDEWAAHAREAAAGGDLRIAVRLLYLGTLAALGGRGIIALRRGKSNLDYVRELRRRARLKCDVIAAFESNLGTFESSWYGLHTVTAESLAACQANFERIRRDEP